MNPRPEIDDREAASLRAALIRAEAAERALAETRRELHAVKGRLERVEGSLRYRAAGIAARLFAALVPRFLKRPIMAAARGVHRRLGRSERPIRRKPLRETPSRPHGGPSSRGPASAALAHPLAPPAGRVTVIVPIFNAFEAVERCLAALDRWTRGDVDILLIDDGGTDPRIAPLLREFTAERAHIRAILRRENWGYTRTVNQGIAEAGRGSDVILLNSDTEVGPLWLPKLRAKAYSAEDVASVTAMSDNAGAFSAPAPEAAARRLGSIGLQRVAAKSDLEPVETPTANGFCVYLRRTALDAVGGFDAQAFPKGYGEENDWSMRASAAGFRHLVAPDVYVPHARSQSFGPAKDALLKAGRAVVDERWPSYAARARAFAHGEAMSRARAALERAWTAAAVGATDHGDRRHPTVLFVHHQAGGGTPRTNADLMAGLADKCRPLRLFGDGRTFVLERRTPEGFEELERFRLEERLPSHTISDAVYEGRFARLLDKYAVELVHVRHLYGHPLALLGLARRLGRATVFSMHDFFSVCPNTHLVNGDGRHCAGDCGSGGADCEPLAGWSGAIGRLRGDYVERWRGVFREHVFAHADAVVTTSPEAARLHRAFFDGAMPALHVIEHGRDLERRSVARRPGSDAGPIRIVLLGALTAHKGGELLRRLRKDPRARRYEFHLLGRTWPDYADEVVHHGAYERDALGDAVAAVRPSAALFASIWPETYCHTLTEAWCLGLPVVASRLGALGERVAAHGGGLTFDPEDPSDLLHALDRVCDPDVWDRIAEEVRAYRPRSIEDMARDYWALYETIWTNAPAAGRSPEAPTPSSAEPPIRPAAVLAERTGAAST